MSVKYLSLLLYCPNCNLQAVEKTLVHPIPARQVTAYRAAPASIGMTPVLTGSAAEEDDPQPLHPVSTCSETTTIAATQTALPHPGASRPRILPNLAMSQCVENESLLPLVSCFVVCKELNLIELKYTGDYIKVVNI